MSPEAKRSPRTPRTERKSSVRKLDSLWVVETPAPLEYMQARENLRSFLQRDPDEVQTVDELAKRIDIGPDIERTIVFLNEEVEHVGLSKPEMNKITGAYSIYLQPPHGGTLNIDFESLNIILTYNWYGIRDQVSLVRRNTEKYILSGTKYVCAKHMMRESLLFSSPAVLSGDDEENEYETFNPVQFPNQDNISGYLHSLKNAVFMVVDFADAYDKKISK